MSVMALPSRPDIQGGIVHHATRGSQPPHAGGSMAGLLTREQLQEAVAEGRVDTIVACFPDMQGRLIGKRFQAGYFVAEAFAETHACDYLLANDIDMEPVPGYAAASWEKGYGDFVMRPDLATLRLVPWLPGTALVLCDVLDHHNEPVPHGPRAVLQRQVARLAERGMTACLASELEFYLFEETFRSAQEKHYRDLRTAGTYIQDYHVFQTSKEEPVMRAIRNGLQAAGIPVENSKGEWGPGQEEINVRYADALTMADRHVILKNAVKEIAHLNGHAVTFMAKWRYDLAGSSCHIHASLRGQDGTPLFRDAEARHGMSALMRQFLAGQLKYARDTTLLLAPYINSYKRFQAATFAPTNAVWSTDNRTAGFRVCAAGTDAVRIECRIGGADLNPYLAYAGLLAAGLAGIDEALELEPAVEGDAYRRRDVRRLPSTLREAVACLDASTMLRRALGDDTVEHYLHAARWEQQEYDRRVTDWELQRGFERS
jgi:glutamine synthetase